MDNIVDQTLVIVDEYSAETTNILADALSAGLITTIEITNGVNRNSVAEIFKGLHTDCNLKRLYVTDFRDGFGWSDHIDIPINFRLDKLKIISNNKTLIKYFELLSGVQINRIVVVGIDIYNPIRVDDIPNFLFLMRNNVSLETICLSYTTVTKEFIECLPLTIQKLKLHYCTFNEGGMCALISYIYESKNMKRLYLLCNDYDEINSHLQAELSSSDNIFSAIKYNDTIKYLTIRLSSECNISDVIDYVQHTRTLQYLDLSTSELRANVVDIFRVLSTNNTVQKLIVSCCKITDYKPIHDMLIVNDTLRKLDLSDNHGSENNVYLIADALIVNTTLTSLNIRTRTLTDSGIKSIADALSINNTLTSLNIVSIFNNCNRTNYVVECLKVNTGLRKLSISYATNVADLINASQTLEKLYLSNPYRQPVTGWTELIENLKTNNTLFVLNISFTVDEDIKKTIKTLIDRNISIRTNNRFIKTKAIMHQI